MTTAEIEAVAGVTLDTAGISSRSAAIARRGAGSDRSQRFRGDILASPVLAIAWLITLALGSIGPQIVWDVVLRRSSGYLGGLIAQIIGLAIVLGLTWLLPSLAPMRGLVWTLSAIQFGYLMAFMVGNSPAWHRSTGGMPRGAQFIASEMLKTIPTLLLGLSLIGSGLRRQDVFLTPGSIQAMSEPTLVTGLMPWTRLGPILLLVFTAPLALYVVLTRGPDLRAFATGLRTAPLVLPASAVNAFNEEFIFRAVLFARLVPVIGPSQSLWVTAVVFGIGHWYGNPKGPIGVLMATVAGWFWGKSILETRGLFWAWLIHGAQDVVIYGLIAMGS